MGGLAALDGLAGVLDDLVGDLEGLLRVEAQHALGRGELVGAQGRAVDLARVLLVRCRPADDRAQDDEGRLVDDALRCLDRRVQLGDVLGVDTGLLPVDDLHVPVVGLVAGLDVLRERDVGVILDRDLVRVVDRDEIAELLVTGERGCLRRYALLQVAVARDDVDEVVERARARRCVGVEEPALIAARVGEADGRRDALTEGTRGDLHTRGVAILRVSGSFRAPGAQRLDVVEFEAVAAEVELDVLGERTVAHREDEAVATDPRVVAGVAAHDLLEQKVRGGGEAHSRARVAVADLFDGIGSENTRRVYCLVVNGIPLESCHDGCDPSSAAHCGLAARAR